MSLLATQRQKSAHDSSQDLIYSFFLCLCLEAGITKVRQHVCVTLYYFALIRLLVAKLNVYIFGRDIVQFFFFRAHSVKPVPVMLR